MYLVDQRVGTSTDMFEPDAGSALAAYSTGEYPELAYDIRGRARNGDRIPGASLLPGPGVTREMPTREGSGADFYVPPMIPPNTIGIKNKIPELEAYAFNGMIYTKVPERGCLWVYDISGRSLHQQNLTEGLNAIKIHTSGILILRFASESGEVSTKKVVL